MIHFLHEIKLGTVGDWISALVGVSAIYATISLWRHDKVETQKEAIEHAQRLRLEVASRVNAWLDVGKPESSPVVGPACVVLENRTDGPVYTWHIRVFIDPPAREFELSSVEYGVIAPYGGRLALYLPGVSRGDVLATEFEFQYVLADGLRWQRSRDGSLNSL